MYYIAGWVLNYIKQRCEHDGDKCGSPWLWPVWVLHNVLNPIKNSHGGIINSLLTAIIREGGRAFDRLAYCMLLSPYLLSCGELSRCLLHACHE